MRQVPGMFMLLLVMLAVPPAGMASQDATPEVLPATPEASECRVEPRSVDEVLRLAGTSSDGTTLVEGEESTFASAPNEPADEAAVAGVTATAREVIACVNAGDLLRLYSLFTDEFLSQGGFDLAGLDEPAQPLSSDERAALLGVFFVRAFPDGRVGAIVATDDPSAPSPVEPIFYLFVRVGDRWLIDDLPDPFSVRTEESTVEIVGTPVTVPGEDG